MRSFDEGKNASTSLDTVTENALHRPRVGGSSDWTAKQSEFKGNVLLSTDPESVEAATGKLILLTNHAINWFNSYSVVASTNTGSVESPDKT